MAAQRSEQLEWENKCLHSLVEGEDAWSLFMELFGKCMFIELAMHRIFAGPERDDILQEVAVRLMEHDWRVVRRYIKRDMGFSFKSLLCKVVNSSVQNYRRKHKNWNTRVEFDNSLSNRPNKDSDPAKLVETKMTESALLSKVIGSNENREAYRILYLRFIEGESVKDIARELDSTPNAVSQRLRYYRKRVKTVLGREVEL